MFQYPWGDFHSLNLGWFIQQFSAWVEKIQKYLDNGGGTSENLANVIAPVFNAENSYLTGDYVLYNDELYKANQAVNPGTWNPDAWTRCLVTEEMGSGSGGVDNVARLMIAGQYSNTYNYQKYAICRYDDKLWMCNTNLPAGGEEWEPSHWDEITVGAGLTGLRRSADTLSQDITALNNSVSNIQGQISAYVETGSTASRAYGKGQIIIINGLLYIVLQPIASGAALTPGTNIERTTTGNEFSKLVVVESTLTFENGAAFFLDGHIKATSRMLAGLSYLTPGESTGSPRLYFLTVQPNIDGRAVVYIRNPDGSIPDTIELTVFLIVSNQV